jgi:DNA-binding IclR family transcriptional regulator
MRQPAKKNNSIDKALTILSAFAPYNNEMGTIEISRKLGFHKATVSRILLNLTRHGFLHQNPKTKKFVLGPTILTLSGAVRLSLNNNMLHIAKPFIDELRDRIKETVVLEVISGENTIIVYIAEGPRPIRIAGTVGDILPAHVAAGAKAILAFSSPNVWKRFFNAKLPSFTENTITDPKVLHKRFEEIRREGFAFDKEEHDIGINAIGAPIFNNEEKPVASVVVAGPSQRITWDRDLSYVTKVKETAAKISAQLFYVDENLSES